MIKVSSLSLSLSGAEWIFFSQFSYFHRFSRLNWEGELWAAKLMMIKLMIKRIKNYAHSIRPQFPLGEIFKKNSLLSCQFEYFNLLNSFVCWKLSLPLSTLNDVIRFIDSHRLSCQRARWNQCEREQRMNEIYIMKNVLIPCSVLILIAIKVDVESSAIIVRVREQSSCVSTD